MTNRKIYADLLIKIRWQGEDEALDAWRRLFMRLVQKRFPEQVELANQVSMQLHDMDLPQTVSDSLLDAESDEDVHRVLMQALQSVDRKEG